MRAWHLPKLRPTRPLFSRSFWNSSVLPIKKGDFSTGGGSTFVQFKKGKQKMKNVFKFIALSALLMSFALFAGSVFAQTSTTGSIEGSVTDSAGAAVPGISVKVSSPNLISAQTATKDQSGRYRVLNLPPGKYSVTVEADKA